VYSDTGFIVPPDPLAVNPLTDFFDTLSVDKSSFAMLLASLPGSLVAAAIWPSKNSFAFLFVFKVLSFVDATV
jgi:hypothetical protein